MLVRKSEQQTFSYVILRECIVLYWKMKGTEWLEYIHNLVGCPEHRVSVEIQGWVEPEVKLLLTITKALSKDISVHNIGISREVAQKFKIYFVVFGALRR